MDLAACPSCSLVQLGHVVDPAILFGNYLYSSSSGHLGGHFDDMARHLVAMLGLGAHSLAVDIGSNDGLLLSKIKGQGVSRVIGVEPAANMAATANESGVPTIHGFFSGSVVDSILEKHDEADLITAANVFAHVDRIRGLTEDLKRLLKLDGAFVIEVPYLPVMLRAGTFDLVYHEHLSYFGATPLAGFFDSMGMNVFRVEAISTHGGSIRVFVQHSEGGRPIDESVGRYLDDERYLSDPAMYSEFGRKATEEVGEFAEDLRSLKNGGASIAGYAAPAKASTLLGFAGIDRSVLDYVVDDNPLKQGRYVPGTGIPIVSSARLTERPPDYLVILAWNLADVIIEKLDEYREAGMRFLIPFDQARSIG